jgi:hypothetical protein
MILPFEKGDNDKPTDSERLLLEELGIAGHPSMVGGMVMNYTVQPTQKCLFQGSHRAILVQNDTEEILNVSIPGQALTTIARELVKIANSPPTDIEFLKKVAAQIHKELRNKHGAEIENKRLTVHVVTTRVVATNPDGTNLVNYNIIYTQDAQ